ncbi:MAG: matrixin family metalloprotease [Anaerolineaceae bacterium]
MTHSHSWFRGLPLIGALSAVAVCSVALARAADAPPETTPQRVVEVVRYATHGQYTVEKRFWIDLSRAPDAEAVADGAIGLVPGVATVNAQYKIGKHKWVGGSLPLAVAYNPAGSGSNPPAGETIQAAISQWNAVTPSTFSFTYAGATSRGTGACSDTIESDGFNTIQYSTALAFGVLGTTCTLFKGDNSPILEFDMELDAGTTWSVAASTPRGSYDLASTILHELGHAAGVSHPCEISDGCTAAEKLSVMFPYLNGGDQRRTLTDDDRAAIRALYQGGPTPTPNPTPVAIPPFSREFSSVVVSLARD